MAFQSLSKMSQRQLTFFDSQEPVYFLSFNVILKSQVRVSLYALYYNGFNPLDFLLINMNR